MPFYTKLTAIGAQKVADAIANTSPLVLTEMAVGDGNGSAVPDATGNETTLVNEVYRDDLNRLDRISGNEEYVEAELIIPDSAGGWTVRELGLYDADGDLIAYGNLPEVSKSSPGSGTAQEIGVRTAIYIETGADVTLIVDPALIQATRAWVTTNFAGINHSHDLLYSARSNGVGEWTGFVSYDIGAFVNQDGRLFKARVSDPQGDPTDRDLWELQRFINHRHLGQAEDIAPGGLSGVLSYILPETGSYKMSGLLRAHVDSQTVSAGESIRAQIRLSAGSTLFPHSGRYSRSDYDGSGGQDSGIWVPPLPAVLSNVVFDVPVFEYSGADITDADAYFYFECHFSGSAGSEVFIGCAGDETLKLRPGSHFQINSTNG